MNERYEHYSMNIQWSEEDGCHLTDKFAKRGIDASEEKMGGWNSVKFDDLCLLV